MNVCKIEMNIFLNIICIIPTTIMSVYTKTQLQEMNSSTTMGFNWIKNIDSINDAIGGKIYPTGDAGLMSGRIYIALPANIMLTSEIKNKYNIWL